MPPTENEFPGGAASKNYFLLKYDFFSLYLSTNTNGPSMRYCRFIVKFIAFIYSIISEEHLQPFLPGEIKMNLNNKFVLVNYHYSTCYIPHV